MACLLSEGTPTICIEFVGYLWIGAQLMLYPLYCPPTSLNVLKINISLFTYLQSQLAKSSRIPARHHYADRRHKLLNTCWPVALIRANITHEALETEALPWLSQFMYDNRRVAARSMDDSRIFSLGNFFGNATNPPVDTLALVASCCYQALLARLIAIWGVVDLMPDYPSPSQTHAELCKTAMMLLLQVEDPMYVSFMGKLEELCSITQQLLSLMAIISFDGCTEVSLISWLQKQGHDTLPASLYITASVLFGWVDTHDLMTLLDVSLKEVAMQMQLRQEEERSCMAFRSRGGCLMEHRIYRAQMEVSLFSNGIANLSEELEMRCSSGSNKPGSTTKNVVYAGACPAPSSIMFNQFQPTKAIQDKCNAWLITTLHFQGIIGPNSHANQMLFGSPQTLNNDPYLHESFQGSKTMDIFKSDMHILGLKKQRAQAKVDMFSEALARIAEFEGTNDARLPPSKSASESSQTSNPFCWIVSVKYHNTTGLMCCPVWSQHANQSQWPNSSCNIVVQSFQPSTISIPADYGGYLTRGIDDVSSVLQFE
ncbi:hypothetical protein EV424DRAFT_1347489 [Suillus variegatus]|nr:hypothetical protein EV424DRAFT_1347489 [Suillus variegatus]